MTTQTILAEDLQGGDVIVYPATTQTSSKFLLVKGSPKVSELTSTVLVEDLKTKKQDFREYGRMVDLQVQR